MKRSVALAFAFTIGVVSALGGVWLARGSVMSEGFVAAAVLVWVGFVASVWRYNARAHSIELRALRANDAESLRSVGFGRAADVLDGSLVDGASSSHPRRRRMSMSQVFRDGSAIVPAELRPGPWLSAGQAFLISLGLFGTFVGLSYGLQESIPYIDQAAPEHASLRDALTVGADGEDREALAMQEGMSRLLGGARTAFSKSVAGIGLGLSYMLLWRLAQAEHRRRLEKISLHIDGFFPYVSADDLLREQLSAVVDELRSLRAAQPDAAALSGAGARLSDGANSLAAVAERLGGVSDVLGEFRAETIAREVAAGVRSAVDQSLAPALQKISDELRILHDMKREQDDAVSRQLRSLVETLRDEALVPMSREIAATNEQTRDVAAVVRALGATVTESTAAAHAATVQMTQLTGNLSAFQRDALGQLNEFADSLGVSVERQRAAFEQSANSATRSFAAQTTALTSAGDIASDAIRRAGQEASETLVTVRTTFADALSSQQESLKAVLAELEGSFRRDLAEREKFERLTSEAITKVQKLVLATTLTDAQLRQSTIEAANTLGRELGVTGRQIEVQREALEDLRGALAEHLRSAADAHREFLRKEDEHLADVLGKLYGLVDEIVRTTRSVQDRANGGAVDVRT